MDYEMIHASTLIRYKTTYEQQVSNIEPIYKIKSASPSFLVLSWSGDKFVWTEAELPYLDTYEDSMVKLSFQDLPPLVISPKTLMAGPVVNSSYINSVGICPSSPRPGMGCVSLDTLDNLKSSKSLPLLDFSLGQSKDPVGIPSWAIKVPVYRNLVLGNGLVILTK
jgi:hypothetical protein